jgi:hypothetical protein
VTTARCPACGASVLDGAPWCTLCYADLRAPVPAPVADIAAQASSTPSPAAPAPAPATTPLAGGVDLLDPAMDAPVSVSAHVARGPVTWPCTGCGAGVALEHDSCPQCLTPFLAGADPAAVVDIPLVGSLRPLTATKSSRVWLMIGGTVLFSLVLTVVLTLIGLLL